MADSKDAAHNASTTNSGASSAASEAAHLPKPPPRPQNPALKMMGLPNIRWRLPSRNWLIFFSIVGSWTGAWYYDRREQKRLQRKWCDAVRHLAQEPLPANQLARKMTVYLAAPPAEGVMSIREHFHEYVKPVLVAAGMDWEAVEGRREGDVRAQLASRIRRARRKSGEGSGREGEEALELDEEDRVQEIRDRLGIRSSGEVGGDLVLGRHTWKEYVRGLHEGWLGPLKQPETENLPQAVDSNGNGDLNGSEEKPPRDRPHDIGSIPTFAAEKVLERATKSRHKDNTTLDAVEPPTDSLHDTALASDATESPQSQEKAPEEPKKEDESTEKKKKRQPPPYISTSDYPSAELPPSIPHDLPPSITIPFPHILGFRNTPIRIYRFLTRRHLADDIGRQVAAAVFAAYRPFHDSEGLFHLDKAHRDDLAAPPGEASLQDSQMHLMLEQRNKDRLSQAPQGMEQGVMPMDSPGEKTVWEQESLLKQEEREWHKSVWKREEGEEQRERTWLDPMVLDNRIAERMMKFELPAEEEERAKRIGEGKEGPVKRMYPSDDE